MGRRRSRVTKSKAKQPARTSWWQQGPVWITALATLLGALAAVAGAMFAARSEPSPSNTTTTIASTTTATPTPDNDPQPGPVRIQSLRAWRDDRGLHYEAAGTCPNLTERYRIHLLAMVAAPADADADPNQSRWLVSPAATTDPTGRWRAVLTIPAIGKHNPEITIVAVIADVPIVTPADGRTPPTPVPGLLRNALQEGPSSRYVTGSTPPRRVPVPEAR